MVKFSSKPLSEHAEVPLADDGRLEELVSRWSERGTHAADATGSNDCYVVSVGAARDPLVRAAQMAEIVALVESQGGRVAGQEICHLSVPDPRTLLGKGTAEQVAARARACGATLLVLDAELSPSQTRNLEDTAHLAICDREAIILNVFLRHARTRRARIQVAIAQLQYLRPRIRGLGLDMDQQTGGTARARGPGETASELLARKLDGRLEELKKALRAIETSGRTQRRQRGACKRIVLVGYTNAGKTSLMNALTAADLSADGVLFETLDTTSRCLTRHGGEVLISDTVGFIRRLPAGLLASFESTLVEIAEASLLVIVVDAADYERDLQLRTTVELLERMGAADVPRLYVFNKLDLLSALPDANEIARCCPGHPWATVSARDASAMSGLRDTLLRTVRRDEQDVTVHVPYEATDVLGLLYRSCRVLQSTATDQGLTLRIQGPAAAISRIRRRPEVTSS